MSHRVHFGPTHLGGIPILGADFNERLYRSGGLGWADLFPGRDLEPTQQPVDARRADSAKPDTNLLRAIQMPRPQRQHVFHTLPAWLLHR
ncbi:MAG: hypothetical protein ACK459_11055 [Akkermansiaceae bacterium]